MIRPTGRLTQRLQVSALAAVAYIPLLLTAPGRMVGDTKLYLYLDPGRLLSDAAYSWDSRQFGGWVPHQMIAYLWPQGPWYWTFDRLGVPDWIAHRLWLGTLLFVAALGVRWLARLLGLAPTAAAVAAVVYQLSPYVLPYASRTSAMLLPWAAVGWIVGLTIVAARDEQRWRAPAALALVLVSCSAVNATAILMIAPAPVIWLADAVARRTITWRRAVGVAMRVAVLAIGVSAWWIAMVRVQGRFGADVLGFSESVQATSFTTASTEVLRGMGYWLFYIRDPYSFATTASGRFMGSGSVIAASFALLVVCLVGLAVVRWSARRFAALLVFVGTVIAVGVHPIDDPSPLMSAAAANTRSAIPLALRSSARAVPLVVLGLALGAAALVQSIGPARSSPRRAARWTARSAPWIVVALAVLNMPALFTGEIIDPALQRDQAPPAAWLDAAAVLDATGDGARVLQLPGAEFGAFRWGYTADPPLPGLTTKPMLTRDLLPLGSAQLLDLFYALDDRAQAGTLDPTAVAPVARLLGADTIWVPNDLAFDRYRNPWPADSYAVLVGAPGLSVLGEYGDAIVSRPDVPMVDDRLYGSWGVASDLTPDEVPLPMVTLLAVDDPVPAARLGGSVVVLVGSGDGVVDAAAAGVLTGRELLIYAADIDGRTLGGAPVEPGLVVVTDSNRDRAHHWRSSQDVVGYTETGGPEDATTRVDEADARLPIFGDPDALAAALQTVAVLDGVRLTASGYGEGFAYLPEHRPSASVDGDPTTSWTVGDHGDPVGHTLTIDLVTPVDHLTLLQPSGSVDRVITEVRVSSTSGSATVELGDESLRAPGQVIPIPNGASGLVTIEITRVAPVGDATAPTSGVGFAELGVGPFPEFIRVPELPEALDADTPLTVVLTRLRVDARNRWRSDPERAIRRIIDVDVDRRFDLAATLRLDSNAADDVLAEFLGTTGATASRRIAGDPLAGGAAAIDGRPDSAWTSPFNAAVGSTLTVDLDAPLESFDLVQRVDASHSTITAVTVAADGWAPVTLPLDAPDADGRSTVRLPTALTADVMHLTVAAINPSTTVDRRFGETVTLPTAIIEIESPSVAGPVVGTSARTGCRSDLVSIDDIPVAVDLTVDALELLVAGRPADVVLCDDLRLSRGEHRLATTSSTATGLEVDRIVLRSGSSPAPSGPTAVAVSGSRTGRRIDVPPCPDGCWLVAGEGYNPQWDAAIDGASLGRPVPLAGGSLGWWLSPSTAHQIVTLRWPPQRLIWAALTLSLASVLLCLVVVARRRRGWPAQADTFPPALADPRDEVVRSRAALAVAVALPLLTALVAAPTSATIALPFAALVAGTRRPRLLGLAAPALAALFGAYTVARQVTERIVPNQVWVLAWQRLHRPGMLLVVLLLLATMCDREPEAAMPQPDTTPR